MANTSHFAHRLHTGSLGSIKQLTLQNVHTTLAPGGIGHQSCCLRPAYVIVSAHSHHGTVRVACSRCAVWSEGHAKLVPSVDGCPATAACVAFLPDGEVACGNAAVSCLAAVPTQTVFARRILGKVGCAWQGSDCCHAELLDQAV